MKCKFILPSAFRYFCILVLVLIYGLILVLIFVVIKTLLLIELLTSIFSVIAIFSFFFSRLMLSFPFRSFYFRSFKLLFRKCGILFGIFCHWSFSILFFKIFVHPLTVVVALTLVEVVALTVLQMMVFVVVIVVDMVGIIWDIILR